MGFQKGQTSWNKGKHWPKEIRQKMGLANIGQSRNKGFKHTEESKRHMSEGRIGMKLSEEHKRNIGKGNSGSNCHLWKGGIVKEEGYDRRRSLEYRHKKGISKRYRHEIIGFSTKYHRQKRKALMKGGGKLSLKTIQMVYEDNIKKFGTLTCYLCKNPIPFGKDHLEHKIPLSREGTNEYNNLAIACQHCNCRKHNKTEEEYRKEILSRAPKN